MEKPLNMKHSYNRNLFLFIFGTLIGIIVFFVPIGGKLPFERMYKGLSGFIGDYMIYLILGIVTFRFFGYFYAKFIAKEGTFMYRFFEKSTKVEFVLYTLAFAFTVMVILQKGIPIFYSDKTAGMMIKDVLPHTMCILPIGGLFLPFLASFGILQVVGALLEPIMRPILKLPGKSALDAVYSIVGAAVMGIFFTSTLYHDNEYTDKEASCISTSFSLNSVGYCAFLIGYVGLMSNFSSLFLQYSLIAFIMSAIIIRIPPLSRHADIYENGIQQTDEMRKENSRYNMEQIKKGFNDALLKADESEGLLVEVKSGLLSGIEILFSIVPMMIAIAGLGLAVYEFTPIISILSKPLVAFTSLLGVADPAIAAEAIFTGIIDLFLPSVVIGAAETVEATRYFVVMVSLLQILYITETMLPVISFGLPVKFWELIVIWLERTLIAMPIIAIFMHILF